MDIIKHSGTVDRALGERKYQEKDLKTREQLLNFKYLEKGSNGMNASGVALKTAATEKMFCGNRYQFEFCDDKLKESQN